MSTTKFKSTVSSIISSRLQYIKFKQQRLFATDKLTENSEQPFQITDDASAAYAHTLIMEFESSSRAIRLLTLMWNHLKTNNSKVIFELLSNNKYLNYSVEDLFVILNPKSSQSVSLPLSTRHNLGEY